MYPRKGTLHIGSDADLIVIDPEHAVELRSANLHSAVDYSPFEGRTVYGMPSWTISRGAVVVEEGNPVARPGRGQLVPRSRIEPAALP